MNFYNPNVIFEGIVQLENDPTADNHAARKSWIEQNAIMAIHTDSSLLAETQVVNGQKQLKLKSLAVTDVQVDSSAASLSAWVSANYTNGNEVQEGDMIILTATASARTETYIHNGGNAGTTADFTEIQGSDVSGSEVRSYFSGGTGIDYNSTTGEFSANNGEIRGFFGAGTGLAYDGLNGVFSLNVDSDGISEGATNLYFSESRSRNSISVAGAGLTYNAGTGVITAAIGSDDITEETALFYTDARSRAALSAATVAAPDVQLLSYSSSTGALSVPLSGVFAQFSAGAGLAWDGGGQFSLDANTDDITELAGATNRFFSDALAQAAISVSGAGLAYNAGVISLNASTDDIQEGNNLYFTQARSRQSIQADSAVAENLIDYDNATGNISVDLNLLRKEFANQSLTANTFLTLNHGLGKKFIHVSAYDANGNLVMLDVQAFDANNCKVKAGSNKTGLTIVVSV